MLLRDINFFKIKLHLMFNTGLESMADSLIIIFENGSDLFQRESFCVWEEYPDSNSRNYARNDEAL
jgi:hypothetical protein